MRFFEIVNAVKTIAPKSPDDLEREQDRQAKARTTIQNARSRAQKAAKVYQDQMQADDDAERQARRRLGTS